MQYPVAARQGLAILAVSAANHPDHRYVATQAVAHHALVTGGHASVGELQITQRIVFVHIHSGVVQHQEPYLRQVMAFIGIHDVTFIHAEGVNLSGDFQEKGINHAKALLAQVA